MMYSDDIFYPLWWYILRTKLVVEKLWSQIVVEKFQNFQQNLSDFIIVWLSKFWTEECIWMDSNTSLPLPMYALFITFKYC